MQRADGEVPRGRGSVRSDSLELHPTQSNSAVRMLPDEASMSHAALESLAVGADGEDEAQGLPPVDGGKGAWQFIMAATVLELIIWGYSFTFGIVQVYLSTHPPFNSASIAAINAVGTIALLLQYVLPVFGTMIFRRYPDWSRALLWSAVALNFGAMMISSFAKKVWQLIVLQGVLAGASGAVLYTPVLIWLNEWWIERRGMASGILFGGTGLGGIILPFVTQSLLDKLGFANAIRVWASFTCVSYAICVYYLRPRIPLRAPRRGERRGAFLPLDLKNLVHPHIICTCVITFCSSLAYFPVTLYIPSYTVELASTFTATLVLLTYNIAYLLGLVMIGRATDRFSTSSILCSTSLACSLIAYLAWGFANSLWKVYLFVILFGLFSGIPSVWSGISRDVAGSNSQLSSLILCCLNASRGIAGVIGPLIASSLYDQKVKSFTDTGYGSFGFHSVILFVGTAMLMAAAGAVVLGGVKHFRA